MKNLNKFLEEEFKEGNDRLWAMSFLKQLGHLGKGIYRLMSEGEAKKKLGENLINIKNKLENL